MFSVSKRGLADQWGAANSTSFWMIARAQRLVFPSVISGASVTAMIVYPSFSKLSCPVLARRGGRRSDPFGWVVWWTEARSRDVGVFVCNSRPCLGCPGIAGTTMLVFFPRRDTGRYTCPGLAFRDATDPFIVVVVVHQEPCDSSTYVLGYCHRMDAGTSKRRQDGTGRRSVP